MPQWEVTDNHTGDAFTIDADETPTQEFVADYLQKQQDEAVKRTSEAFKGVKLSPYEQQSLGMGGRVSEPAMIDAPALIQQIRETPRKLEELGGRAADWLGQRMQEPSGDMPRFQTPEGIAPPSPEDLAKTSEQVGEELSPTALPNWATATGAFERYMPESVKPAVRKIVGTLGGGVVGAAGETLAAIAPKTKLGEIGEGIAEAQTDNAEFFTSPLGIATLGLGAAPKLAQRGIALAFSADMGRQVPQLATRLGELLAEPEEKRDWKEISKVIAQGAAAVGFSAASGMHGLAPSRAVPAVKEAEAAPLELKESDFPTELQRPEIAAAPRPFFDRQSEALGLGRPSTAPTVEDVRAHRAAEAVPTKEATPPTVPGATFDSVWELAPGKKMLQYTFRGLGEDPAQGMTFYVPEGSTAEVAIQRANEKLAEFKSEHRVPDPAADRQRIDEIQSQLKANTAAVKSGSRPAGEAFAANAALHKELEKIKNRSFGGKTPEAYDMEKAGDLMETLAKRRVEKVLAGKEVLETDRGTPYIVKSGEFMGELKKAGIPYPTDAIAFAKWAKPIADEVLPKWHKALTDKKIPPTATPRVNSLFDTLPPSVEDVRAQRSLEGRQAEDEKSRSEGVIAKGPTKDNPSKDNAQFRMEWRARKLTADEFFKMADEGQRMAIDPKNAWVVEQRRVDREDGKETPRDWQYPTLGKGKADAIRNAVGSTDFEQARSLDETHSEVVSRVKKLDDISNRRAKLQAQITPKDRHTPAPLNREFQERFDEELRKRRLTKKAAEGKADQKIIDEIKKPLREEFFKRKAEIEAEIEKLKKEAEQIKSGKPAPKEKAPVAEKPKPTPAPAKPAKRQKALLRPQQISDFRQGVDKVERRGDKTFVVDTEGQRAPIEVQHDALTPETEANLRSLPKDKLAEYRRQTAETPFLSAEGKAERLKVFDELMKREKPAAPKSEHAKLAERLEADRQAFKDLYEKANSGENLTEAEINEAIGNLQPKDRQKMAAAIGSVRRIFEKQQAAPERAARFQEPDTRRVEAGGEEESGAVKPPPEQTEMRLTAEKKPVEAPKPAAPTEKVEAATESSQAQLAKALEHHETTEEIHTVDDLVNDVESIISESKEPMPEMEQAVEDYRQEERDNREFGERGDMDSAREKFVKEIRKQIAEKPVEPTPPVVEPPKPPEPPQPADVVEEGGGGQYGIAHRVREERAAAGQVAPVERGEGVTREEAVQRGRDILAADPQAGEKAMAAFEADGTLLKNANAVTRAHGEQLAKTAEAMRKEHGDKSPEYLEAKKALSDWDKRTKKLQTAWHEAGMEQQGATDLDTGNFVAMERAYEEATGEKLEGDKKKTVEDMTERKKKVDEEVEKGTNELANEIARKTMTDAERAAFDAANKTVREWAIRRAKAENKQRVADEKLRQATRQVQEDAKDRAEAIRRKTTRSAEQRAAAAENLARAKAAKLAKEVADIEVKRVRQRQEVIWKRTRDAARAAAAAVRKDLAMSSHERVLRKAREYIEDLGMNNLDEIRNKIATDLGMKVDEVTRLLAKDPKVKFMMDSLWTKKQTQRKLQQAAKRWLRDQSVPMVAKALRSIPRVMFGLKVGFHGTVALGTHAPTLAFDPRFWKMYAKNYAKMYRLAGFNVPTPKMQAKARAYYESQVQDLIRREAPGLKPGEKINIYDLARRAGLQNDPFQFEELTAEGQTGLANTVGRKLSRPFAEAYNAMADMGNRGYSVLKFIRQDMFDYHWNRLPNNLKSLEMAKSIADAVNHATGVTKAKGPPGSEIALFAPRLAASRIAFLAVDPIRAAKTFANWKNASKADKWFATEQIKSKATLAATYMGLLALNQGFLSATKSEQQINMSDPFRADYLKFKLGGLSLSYGNPILTLMRLPIRLWGARTPTKGRFANLMYPDESMGRIAQEYIRSQLSPAASTATTLFTKADFQHRPLPDTDLRMPKRLRQQGVEPYTWKEFVLETAAPIPVEEAMREVFRTGMGMSHEQEAQTLKAIATLSVMLATGARVNEDLPYSGDIPPTPMP